MQDNGPGVSPALRDHLFEPFVTSKSFGVGLGLALVCEAHHAIRALATLHDNPGFITSLPMPVVGAFVLRTVFRHSRGASVASVSHTPTLL